MTTQYGPPLTGEQMKLLRDAGFPENIGFWSMALECEITLMTCSFMSDGYCLPADHIAYKVIEAGWLKKPNVRLWFGGDKAPSDWKGGPLFTENGEIAGAFTWLASDPSGYTIIAYIAKDEEEYMPEIGFDSNEVDVGEIVRSIADTVTIAKMTEAECLRLFENHGWNEVSALKELGLIKPEPTRAERFWQGKERHSLYHDESARALIDAALEFER